MKKSLRNKIGEKLESIKKRTNSALVKCNLCKIDFHPRCSFDRFCAHCKNRSGVFHYSEWLPEHMVTF
jgi:hypothetical protein